MTATRVATATLVAMVALTCDITDVEGPPADNPDAVPRLTQLTPQDVIVRSLFHVSAGSEMEFMEMMSAAYPDLPFFARYEDREAETTSAISQNAAQTIVESDSPREADLVLADEPLVRVGLLDGPNEYLFGNITGAVRLEDGSVVVADESIPEVRMFDAGGRHVWTSGRDGEGAGRVQGTLVAAGLPGSSDHGIRLAAGPNHRTRFGRRRG